MQLVALVLPCIPPLQIGRVGATDCDAESQNNLIRYAMRPVPGPIGQLANLYLTISTDGIIYTHNVRLDREETPILSFEVVATDNGRPTLSAFASILIRVLDANDNSPIWLFPKQFASKTMVNISQQATVGLQIAQLKAVDADEGSNGEIIYSILHGNEDGFFEVDPINGALYLAKSLSWFPYNQTTKHQSSAHNRTDLPTPSSHTQAIHRSHIRKGEVYLHKIILKAQDRGVPPRFNTTVLSIDIFQSPEAIYSTHESRSTVGRNHGEVQQQTFFSREENRRIDQDLMIMIVLIALTSIISFILIVAICLIRSRRAHNSAQNMTGDASQCYTVGGLTSTTTPNNKRERKKWWRKPIGRFASNDPLGSVTQQSPMVACEDLYMLSRAGYSTEDGKPINYSDTVEYLGEDENSSIPQKYFTVRPQSHDSRTLSKCPCSHSLDGNNTMPSVSNPDKLSNTYMIQVNPKRLESPYSFLSPRPCTSLDYTSLHYQPLCPSHQKIQSSNPAPQSYDEMDTNHERTLFESEDPLGKPNNQSILEENQYFVCPKHTTTKTFRAEGKGWSTFKPTDSCKEGPL